MATHSSVLAWRIPGTGQLGGLMSMGSHRVGHDWSDLAAVWNQGAWFLQLHFSFSGRDCILKFSSLLSCVPTLCDPMDCSTPGFPVHHQLLELAQTHVHRVSDVIQPSYSLLSPSLPAFSLSPNQGLFQWVSSLHQVAKVLEFQLYHQSFRWIFRTDFL